jgi:hypothetical protein
VEQTNTNSQRKFNLVPAAILEVAFFLSGVVMVTFLFSYIRRFLKNHNDAK